MDKYQGKIVGFGRASRVEVDEYLTNVWELDATNYLKTKEKAGVVVCFKRTDFDVLKELLDRGDTVVLESSPRLTDMQAQVVAENAEEFSRCFYPMPFLYARLFEELKSVCQSGEYGEILSVNMSMRFDGICDMELRRKINSDLATVFTLIGWKLESMKVYGARRAVPSGEGKLVFEGGAYMEYDYQRGANNKSVWKFKLEKAEIKVLPYSGRLVVKPNGGQPQVKRLDPNPCKDYEQREIKSLRKGEKTNMIPLSNFVVLRKVSLRLR